MVLTSLVSGAGSARFVMVAADSHNLALQMQWLSDTKAAKV